MAKTSTTTLADNAYARKALDAIAAIDRDAQKKKLEQVNVLKDALKNIDLRITELQYQREQVEAAIKTITGTEVASNSNKATRKRGRINHQELQDRLIRWLSSHPGATYTGIQLRHEFPELERVPSVAAFLKEPISQGLIAVDKSGGNRNTRYIARAKPDNAGPNLKTG